MEEAIRTVVGKLHAWALELVALLPNLLLASIVLVVGLFVVKQIRGFLRKRVLQRLPDNTITTLADSLANIFLISVVCFTVLKILHLDSTITTMLAGAGVVGLALAFAFQDIAANFVSGIFMSFRKPFRIHDLVKIKDHEGYILEIRLRDTTLRTFQGHYVTLPNREVFQSPIINYTTYGRRRIDLHGGISYNDDPRKAQRVALEALAHVGKVVPGQTTFLYKGWGESAIQFTVRIWMDSVDYGDYLQFISDVVVAVKEAFDKEGISMPFPIRTLDLAGKDGAALPNPKKHTDDQ